MSVTFTQKVYPLAQLEISYFKIFSVLSFDAISLIPNCLAFLDCFQDDGMIDEPAEDLIPFQEGGETWELPMRNLAVAYCSDRVNIQLNKSGGAAIV